MTCIANRPSREVKKSLMLVLWEREGGRCYWCDAGCIVVGAGQSGAIPALAATIDHLVPSSHKRVVERTEGKGRHHPDLCVLACHRCNNQRGARRVLKFVEELYGKDR